MKYLILGAALIFAAARAADGAPGRQALIETCRNEATARGLAHDEYSRYVAQCVKSKESALQQEHDDPVLAAARTAC